jgi:hypothetical protein
MSLKTNERPQPAATIGPAEHNRLVASRWIDAFNARDDTAEAAARRRSRRQPASRRPSARRVGRRRAPARSSATRRCPVDPKGRLQVTGSAGAGHASDFSEGARGRRLRRWSAGFAIAISLLVVSAPAALGATAGSDRRALAPGASAVSSGHGRGVLLPVWVLLDGRTAVSGGRVSVYPGTLRVARAPAVRSLTPLIRERTNAAGVAMLKFARLPRAFTVVVSGGWVRGRRLNGFLSAQLRGYIVGSPMGGVSSGAVVHVNPVTTLVDLWQRVDPRVNLRYARLRIDRALGIPRWADNIDLSNNDQWLDGEVFLRDVRVHGTLNAETGELLIVIRNGGHVRRFGAPPSAHASVVADWWKNTDISQLVKDGLSSIGEGVAQTIGGAGVNWVFAKFLDAVGLGKFKDFLFPIGHMIDQLNAIAAQVTAVKGLVEQGIQATELSQYSGLVARVGWIDSAVRSLGDSFTFEAHMDPNDSTLKNYNEDLIANIKKQLVDADAAGVLNNALAPPTPLAYGILQAASAYLGSRKPFFTPAASTAMQAVFNYYQLIQLRLSILLTNYYSTRPNTFSPQTIQATVLDSITNNIADQRALLKPPLPPGTFIDLRTDKNKTMLMWGPVSWVNGGTLEHQCVDQSGTRHRFYVDVSHLTCDGGNVSAQLKGDLATEAQFKALLDGWQGGTPLAWLQKETGLRMTAAPAGTSDKQIGFYWVGRSATEANRSGPVEGPFCKAICINDNTIGYYEYLHRYDMQDTSTPSPDAWTTSLWDLDPWNYNANAVRAPTPVSEGEYFWPVGGG